MVATEGFPPGCSGEGWCVCCASQPMSGVDGIHVVENRWCVVWEPGQRIILAPKVLYSTPVRQDVRAVTRPNQSTSHVSKNRELWLPLLQSIMSGNQFWPKWWASEAQVAGLLHGSTPCAHQGTPAWTHAEWF